MKVYRIIEERIRHKEPRFFIQKYIPIIGWWELTEPGEHTSYRRDFISHRKAKEYIETHLMKPEIIHHEAYHIAK
jgi:hypothetical protein